MTADFPGEPALALLMAARSEPAPESLRLVTAMGRADAQADGGATAGTRAVAAAAGIGTAAEPAAAMQAAPAIRIRPPGRNGPACRRLRRGSRKCVRRMTIISLLSAVAGRPAPAGDKRPLGHGEPTVPDNQMRLLPH